MGQPDPLHPAQTRPVGSRERCRDARHTTRRRERPDSTEAADHRAHPGHALLYGGDGTGAVRRWRAGRQRCCEAGQVDERGESPRHGAGSSCRTDRPAFGGGEGVAADAGGVGTRVSARAGKDVICTPDDTLERGLSRLQAGEFIYEQPTAGEVEYVFKHALTQEVAYNALLIERRKLLHERAGEALESMYAQRLDDHLGDLARHYSRSDNFSKAVEYLGRAGQQAFQRSAYADAISSLSAATDLLQKLPESPERIQREVLLLLAIGAALIAGRGNTAPEVEAAYSRARELCEQVGDPPELFPVLWGLWLMHLVRGELRRAYELAEQLLSRAHSARDPTLTMRAHLALGNTFLFMGHLISAREHIEIVIPLYD